jgi:hypothetical protein
MLRPAKQNKETKQLAFIVTARSPVKHVAI